MIVRRVLVAADATAVLPVDAEPRSGAWQWRLENVGSSQVELVDDPDKGLGEGHPLPPGHVVHVTARAIEELWALLSEEPEGEPVPVSIIGTQAI